MYSSTRNPRLSFTRPFLGSSPFLTPFALPVQPVLECLAISPASVVIELGAVAGRFTLPVARYLAMKRGTGKVFAFDVNQESVDRTRQKAKDAHLDRFVVTDIVEGVSGYRLPMEDETADVVIAISAPELQSAPDPFIAESLRVLRSSGTLFIGEWRDAREILRRDDAPPERTREAAWRVLKASDGAICAAVDIPGLEWAVTVQKPLVLVP